ncbi:protocadherin-10-like [Pristis pectinata]|uniref:protocadherin-10-like n=1 Tax=Pristis pectinata TaxID=685728 RepID=UPI00223C9AA3|nr:protocadherin-10-like [Pristis pectinata]
MANSQRNSALIFIMLIFILLVCTLKQGQGLVRYSIPEELEYGSTVGNIAENLGISVRELSARKCRLVSADGRQYLEVNLETGVLFVSGRIDREQICAQSPSCNLAFQIILQNPLEMYRGEVEILDINDNSPFFPENAIVLEMAESIAPGSRFPLESALDPDVGTNTVNKYIISPNEHFGLKVHIRKGAITTAELLLEKSLDRERQTSFQLVMTAVDGGNPPRSGTTQINISLLDINDNTPVFENEVYTASLEENAPLGTLVTKIKAVDLDQGTNAELKYSFVNVVPRRVRELFSLDPETGEIKVQEQLDFEDEKSYEIDVQAVDNGSPAITGHSKVLIDLIDVNDNAPEITVTSLSDKLPEGAAPGTVVALMDVTDRDSGANGQVHCHIPLGLPFKIQSSLNNHYKLTTTRMLDRETTPIYNIPVIACDSGSPPLSTNKTIRISVSDINDNTPRFSQSSYAVYVMENNAPGASIFTLTAFDPDLDQNSYISYSLGGNLQHSLVPIYFSINSINGTIYALPSFDYEKVKTFQIRVQARDAGVPPLSSSATVNVIILDQNDNAPVIVSPSAQSGSAAVEILPQSAAQGYLVTKIMATDADSGQNARLSYQMVQATDPTLFIVGRNSGEIRTTRNILELDETSQSLVVLVRDNGQPSLSSTTTILLSILGNVSEKISEPRDSYSNPGYFSDINLYLIVTFGSTSILFLLTIVILVTLKCKQDVGVIQAGGCTVCCFRPRNSKEAFTRGSAPGDPLSCSASGQTASFPESYHYSVCLSPESSKSEFLFLKPYNPSLTEGTLCVAVHQSESQSQREIHCSTPTIERKRNHTEETQHLNLDKINRSRNNGECTAHDRLALLRLFFSIVVSALDVALGQIRYSIPEELERGAIIGNIAEDLGLNVGTLLTRRGRLVSGRIKPFAELNLESGILFVNERIDREKICGSMSSCILPFQIVIENSPEMYRGEVEIVDVNDNSPTFPEGTVLLQMAEAVAPGSRFPLESALDPDVGTNAVNTYMISPNEHFSLKVESAEEGINIAEKPLDREKQSSFHLVLTAVDGGNPQRSGTARVVIHVLDINDNAPVFDRKVYKASLAENSPMGSPVVTVHASDADEGLNAELSYSFGNRVSQKVQELFNLDPRTGEIRLQGMLDFEEANSYALDVQAVDKGSPAITGHSKVLIKVTDVNDNNPEIEVNLVTAEVAENAGRGTVIALINVLDRDSGDQGEVRYQIPSDIPFKLQASSSTHYKLITSDLLDRETAALFNITLLAWDSASPPRSTNKTVQIRVSDVNDNVPRFAQPSYVVYVMENNAPGASIFAVTAFDPDLDQNSYVSYSFTESLIQELPVSSYLNVDSLNGTVYALRSFDDENMQKFQVHVQARDAGVPPLSSSAAVNVIILDQNDNAPVIVSPSAQSGSAVVVIVPQSAGQGYLVTKIMATDADTGQNARLSYQVQRSTDPSLYHVGQNSGEIRTARNILESDTTTQTLVILVKDNGQPSLSSTITILLTVLENFTERTTESNHFVAKPGNFSDLNLYLIVIFGCTSVLFLVTIILLIGIKCNQDRNVTQEYNPPSCCYSLQNSNDNFHLRPQVKESLNYIRTSAMIYVPENHHYSVCLSPESAKSDFLFLKPCAPQMTQAKC